MYAIKGDIGCMVSCPNCDFKDIRLEYPLSAFRAIQSVYGRGLGKCYGCDSKDGVKVVLLKKDVVEKLRENFPNKKVLYTRNTIEELLTLNDIGTIVTIDVDCTHSSELKDGDL